MLAPYSKFVIILLGFASVLYCTVKAMEKKYHSPVKSRCIVHLECDPNAKYRSIDGSCNNLKNPLWGAANTAYARAVPARYADGVHAYPKSVRGKPLPPARALSWRFMPTDKMEDSQHTLLFMQWGQIITHDMSFAKDSLTGTNKPVCCGPNGVLMRKSKGEMCQPPIVGRDDPLYRKYKQKCFDIIRSSTDAYEGCPSGKAAQPLSSVTHWMDASLLYGSNDERSRQVRLFKNGLLKFEIKRDQEWPLNTGNASADSCFSRGHQSVCYRTGDARMNQNAGLAMLQIVLLREHNRLARGLLSVNPGWEDERLFQEARRILIAQFQHISYYEWLPLLFRQMVGEKNAPSGGYDSNLNPSILNEHANGAFRGLHIFISGQLQLINEERHTEREVLLTDQMLNASILEDEGQFDNLMRGHATQRCHAYNGYHDKAVKEDMFRYPITSPVGEDLKTTDIHRNRDHGLGSYNDLRVWCGLPRARTFADLVDTIPSDLAHALSQVYEDVDDVDLSVGGHLEAQGEGGGGLGPTFTCIIREQFRRTRAADRFFYEFTDQPASFTPRQLTEIKKSSMARLICDHGKNITFMQPNAFSVIDKSNAVVGCDAIPAVDLDAWRVGPTTP